ncbi:MAG TPA: hypothetical protein PLV68_03155, partial [Ilumatobacteraceae bacterium]|nr:hypothetical protein [Ilumatobacteraceae bacterium]
EHVLRIDDLGAPVLSEHQQQLLADAEAVPVTLSVDTVLAAARDRSGLSDYGSMDFLDRLSLWLGEIDQDPNRTAYIRKRLFDDCVRFATSRLRLTDLLRRHPEIHDVQIVRPVIVVGMPRTGTTHLVNVL